MKTTISVLLMFVLTLTVSGAANAQSSEPGFTVLTSKKGTQEFKDKCGQIDALLDRFYNGALSPIDRRFEWRITFDPIGSSKMLVTIEAQAKVAVGGKSEPLTSSAEADFALLTPAASIAEDIKDGMLAVQQKLIATLKTPPPLPKTEETSARSSSPSK